MGKVFGILAIIFGIIGILGGAYLLGIIFGPLAIIFGIIGLAKDDNKILPAIGLILGIIAIAIFIWFIIEIGRAIREYEYES